MTGEVDTGASTSQAGVQPNSDATMLAADATTATETSAQDATKSAAAVEAKTTDAEVKYDFKAPDGVELDQARVDEFTTLARELKLPPEQAQKFVDMAAKAEVARMEEHKALVTGWAESVKTDKELGGDKLLENLATAKKTFDLLPADQATELKSILNSTGLEAHPTMFRLFLAVGKSLSEDKFVPATKAANAAGTLENRLYPKQASS